MKRRLLVLVCVLALGFSLGYLVRYGTTASRHRDPHLKASGPAARDDLRWKPLRSSSDEDVGRDLSALGYLQGYSPASERSGVTLHDPEKAWQGANLYVSGHGPTATLVGMDGEVLHEWTLGLEAICPETFDAEIDASLFYRHAEALPDGSLLVVFDYRALARIGPDSALLWKRCAPYHHDLAVGEDGRIYALARAEGSLRPPLDGIPILDDEIHVLSTEGELLEHVSVLDLLVDSDYRAIATRITDGIELERSGDVLHTNSIEVLGPSPSGRLPEYQAGDLLISIRNLDTIAIVDLARGRTVWGFTGPWHAQHDATMLADGNILLFDNLGLITLDAVERSRVLEIDPSTGALAWTYDGRPDRGFGSTRCGTAQRLPNGNTLVTATEEGRAFEVTGEGEVVWEFWNPHRAGDDDELIASLFRVVRLAPEEVGWLPRR